MSEYESVAIIIPTRDNPRYLAPCLASILEYTREVEYHIYVVNNGVPGACDWATGERVTVADNRAHHGWVDGLILGEALSKAPLLLLLNDDTLIPPSDPYWLYKMVNIMYDPEVGAVGPSSNCVSGPQSIWRHHIPPVFTATYLIGFCMLVRRAALVIAGGFDPHMASADDMDLSYRLRRERLLLVGTREVFVFHTGFVTGVRVHGPSSDILGYNSPEWLRRDGELLIAKHGEGVLEYLCEPRFISPYVGP